MQIFDTRMDYIKNGWKKFNLQDDEGLKNVSNFKMGTQIDGENRFNLLLL